MIIKHLRTNHLQNPLGFYLEKPVLSWVVSESTGKKQVAAQIKVGLDSDLNNLVFDSGRQTTISSLGYPLDIQLMPRKRYYWNVTVWAEDGDTGTSETNWFETGKIDEPWHSEWIKAPFEKEVHPLFYKKLVIPGEVSNARLYVTGLGLYEVEINGAKVGDEYLAPFFNDYNHWVQYQTYDITSLLHKGENAVGAILGNGMYKGRFGFLGDIDELYGSEMKLLAELVIQLENGEEIVVGTDETWLCHPSPILFSNIYDGEVYDANLEVPNWSQPYCDTTDFVNACLAESPLGELQERLSPPVKIMQRWDDKVLLETPAGEKVIDFGQVMTGWVEFQCNLPKGSTVKLQFGELLQNGNFYRGNLRSAKQEFTYISAGKPAFVRPHFTFYGFRYMKITGMEDVEPADFTACVIYSQLEATGKLTTSNEKVNRLIENVVWGQRGNFLDVPTDCPQRDERMGWTGDAQVFCYAASYNMYTPAFFRKYLFDMLLEQRIMGGSVPHVVPDAIGQIRKFIGEGDHPSHGSCAWGDAATVIPWALYLFYGDKTMLESQFENMRLWVDFIKNQDDELCGSSRLWQCGFHFADWLSLDNPVQGSSYGGTDPYYVASAYDYYSTKLTAKAAGVLGKEEEHAYYSKLADEIKAAFRKEYFTATGRIAVPTQTAMALALYLDLVPEQFRDRVINDLKKKLDDRNIHLDTGFVGTHILNRVLSANGLSDYAYTLLLNEDYPSWLYQVNMGATTVWERWNSVLPNGMVSDTGMNSMNHYAYGAILEWMYRHMSGLNPCEEKPGFKRAIIRPEIDSRLTSVLAEYNSAAGLYVSGWRKEGDSIIYTVEVPFDAEAEFELHSRAEVAKVNGENCEELVAEGKLTLFAGRYEIQVKHSSSENNM